MKRRAAGTRIARAALSALALVAALAPRVSAAATPAAGGVALLESMESAPVTAVGTVFDVTRMDDRSFRASLRLENVLLAPLDWAAAAADGRPYSFAWVERSPSRPPRFAEGDRILVVLEPLPGDSIWLSRIEDPAVRQQTLHVAARGDAFLRRPALRTVTILEHLLSLAPDDRRSAQGVVYLADLVRTAAAPLAQGAVAALAEVPDLDSTLDRTTADGLVAGLVRGDSTPALRRALLDLIAERRLLALVPALEARIAAARRTEAEDGAETLADPLVYAALAALRGEVDGDTVRALARHPDAAHRSAAVAAARLPDDRALLTGLARYDSDAAVRAAAVRRLAEESDGYGMVIATEALGDTHGRVRQTAAEALARIGPPAVPELRRVTEESAQPAVIAAISALREIRPDGVHALLEIAESAPDESTRAAARLALGQELTPEH